MSDKSFAEVQGAPAVEHKKKLAREAKAAAKKKTPYKEFFTLKDGKVLRVKFKTNGAYSTYVATKAKMKKDAYDLQVKSWKKEGLWIAEEDYQDKSAEIIAELKAQLEK